jgi:hypothetical protein
MADTLIKDLTTKATVAATDQLPINDAAGGDVDKKILLSGVKTFTSDSPTLVTPALGTPASGVLTSCTGLPLTTGVTGVLPSANMDADTAHLTTTQTFSGAKTFTLITTHTAGADMTGDNIDNIQNLIHDISTSGTDIDFNEDEMQTISISGNTTFTTANRAAGKSKTLKITTDGTLRTLTFPGWDWVSDIPASQAASKNGYLTLTSYSTTDAAIVAAYQLGSL